MKTKSCTILSRFKGPPHSGNGGYSSGLLAKNLEGDAKVMLLSPPPLNVPLTIEFNVEQARLLNGEQLVGAAEVTELVLDVPECPEFETINADLAGYKSPEEHVQPLCFVCGPARDKGDGLRIFSRPTSNSRRNQKQVASLWRPDQSLADQSGLVAEEFIWAALDCPGYFAHGEPFKEMLLGTITASIKRRPEVGEMLISLGWQIAVDGRKHFSGTALFSKDKALCATSKQVWIELSR